MSTNISNIVYNWLINSHFWLLPGICMVCRQNSGQNRDLCQACASSLPKIVNPCSKCGLPLPHKVSADTVCGACLKDPLPFRTCCIPLVYCEPVKQLLNAFKHHDKLHVAKILAPVLSTTIRRTYDRDKLPTCLIPVPLHENRLRQRGYNQARILASVLGKVLELSVNDDTCYRVRDTGDQKGLDAKHRRRNLRGAFAINRNEQLRHVKHVAIIDDVVTTMSTARELAKALHRAGVAQVDLWALARTLRH